MLDKRISISEVFTKSKKLTDKQVSISGWIYHKRTHGSLIFFDIRDGTGIIQASAHKDRTNPEVYKTAESVTIESSVQLSGILKPDKRAPNGYEIRLSNLEIIGLAEEWPIPLDAGVNVLYDLRHLHLRTERQWKILKIRSSTFDIMRNWLKTHKYVETTPPMLITAAVEGGSTLFPIKYFDKNAYLTQSSQFYLEALCLSLGRVYCLVPSFRAEKSRTRRHVAEYWHLELEDAFCDLEGTIKIQEQLVTDTCNTLGKNMSKLIQDVGGKPEVLQKLTTPFLRISYSEAITKLQSKDSKIQWGDDLGAEDERLLTEDLEKPVFVHRYPRQAKAFYHKPDPKNPDVVLCADLLLPQGYGEVIGGGQRIHDLNELLERIKEDGLNPEDYKWYIDLRRYGTVPHAGFGLGMSRLLTWILQLNHIRESIPFPRTRTRIYP